MSGLPEGWISARIADFAANDPGSITDGPYGSNLKTEHYTANGPTVIRLGNITPMKLDMTDEVHVSWEHFASLAKHHVVPGDIVMAALGDPIGRACRVPVGMSPAMVKADCFRIRTSHHVDPEYLVRWLNSPEAREAFLAESHGMGRIRINLSDVRRSVVPLPPLPEQRRIVAKLDRLSARSAAARSHLVRTAKLAIRAKQAVLSKIFQEEVGDCEVSTLGAMASHITSGSRDWAQYYDRGEAVFVLAGNIRPLFFDVTPKRYVDPPRNAADARRTRVQRDDLLVTIVGANTGDLCRVDQTLNDYYVCQSVALIRLTDSWRARFVELFLNAEMAGGKQIQAGILHMEPSRRVDSAPVRLHAQLIGA